MTFDAEIMLRNDARVLAETLEHPVAEGAWTDTDVESVLMKILRAIDRSAHPEDATDRPIALRGITWIAHASQAGTVLAVEIHSASAVAGPFDLPADRLEAMVARVMRGATSTQVVH